MVCAVSTYSPFKTELQCLENLRAIIGVKRLKDL